MNTALAEMFPNQSSLFGTIPVVLVCSWADTARAGQPIVLPEWCACETESNYQVTTFAQHGQVTVIPDMPTYPKGAWVTLQFQPDSGYEFVEWEVYPLSSPIAAHDLSPLDDDNSLVVQITSHDINVVAYARPSHAAVNIVNIPPGGTVEGHAGSYSTTIAVGETKTLTAVPPPGHITRWRGESGDPSALLFQDVITLQGKPGFSSWPGTHTLQPWFIEPDWNSSDLKQFTMNLNNGPAHVFSAIPGLGRIWAGSYLQPTTVGPSAHFTYGIKTDPLYDVIGVIWYYDGAYRYTTDKQATNVLGYDHWNDWDIEYTAEIVNTVRLALQIEGQGIVTGSGLQASYHPRIVAHQPYQAAGPIVADVQHLTYSNAVILDADACKGWRFSHWEVDFGYGLEPIAGPAPALPVYMNTWPGPGIRPQEGAQVLHVKAVFVEDPVRVIFIRGWDGIFPPPCSEGDQLGGGLDTLFASISSQGCAPRLEKRIYRQHCVDNGGGGPLLHDILFAIEHEGVRRFAFIGYSRGGGSVANLCKRLANPKPDDDHSNPYFPSFHIEFTGYIDAIQTSLWPAETRRPEDSNFHSNLYQRITSGPPNINGKETEDGDVPNHNINTEIECVENQDHYTILTCDVTHALMREFLYGVLYGTPTLDPLTDICDTATACGGH